MVAHSLDDVVVKATLIEHGAVRFNHTKFQEDCVVLAEHHRAYAIRNELLLIIAVREKLQVRVAVSMNKSLK